MIGQFPCFSLSVPSKPSQMSDPSPCLSPCINPRFFSRIRRFLRLHRSNKQHPPRSDSFDTPTVVDFDQEQQGSSTDQMEIRESGVGGLVTLQRAVKRLHFGGWEEKEAAAEEIRRLARMDLKMKKEMAEFRVVPPLVDMVGLEAGGRRRTVAVQALIELASGSYTNKVLIVEAGILSKLPQNVGVLDESTMHELAQLFLSISSLANNNFPLSSPQILPFLVGILESNSSIETKEFCLCALYNLSTMLENAGNLATNEVVYILLRLSSIEQTSDKALATLGNLVVTLQGKKAMESNSMVPDSFIEILAWEEKPKSQELSAYILMILAHQSSTQRQKMANSGIVPVLLEVVLLSSPLAQKRALKLLQWFKDERQMKMGPHSGPQTTRIAIGSPVTQREANEGKKMMKKLVKQSLYKNMETITQRANTAEDSCSKLKALVISSSSKSLPY